jgi:hypothetical protein
MSQIYFDKTLDLFVSRDELREKLLQPSREETFIYAVDGYKAIKVPLHCLEKEYKKIDGFPDMKRMFDEAKEGSLPEMCFILSSELRKILSKIPYDYVYYKDKCENCGGDGICTCIDCDAEHQCGQCKGNGYIENKAQIIGKEYSYKRRIKIGQNIYNSTFMDALCQVAELGRFEYINVKTNQKLMNGLFSIGDIEIIIMPLKLEGEEDVEIFEVDIKKVS